MSTRTPVEERLTAALHARADQVGPEHLGPLHSPVVPLRPRRGRGAVLATLAVAAVAAAVAGPVLLGTPGGGDSPRPAGPAQPSPTSTGARPGPAADADVDGDGRSDTVRVRADASGYLLVVALAGGDRTELRVPAAGDATPVNAGDMGGTAGDELVVPVSEDLAELPGVYTWRAGEGLVRAPYAQATSGVWRSGDPGNRWWVDLGEHVLVTWNEGAESGGRVPFRDWRIDDEGLLRPGPRQSGCMVAEQVPVACGVRNSPTGSADGPATDGDLPALMPAVEEHLVDERYTYGSVFFGPGRTDWVQLQGDLDEEGGAVEEGQVELVATVDGTEHRAPVPAGQSPWLVPQVLAVDGDLPVFVTTQSGGDLALNRVFFFRDGELVEATSGGEVFLGSGVVEHRGKLTEQRTWVTEHGQLFTAILLDHATRRHQLWRWDVGESVSPTNLGEACIDWEVGTYSRCP